MARLTDPAWMTSRYVADAWRSRPGTLSPQSATASMVRAVVGTMSSAVSVSFSVSSTRKGGHSQESNREPRQEREG